MKPNTWPTRCPNCREIVTVSNGRIQPHASAHPQVPCAGSGRKAGK